MSARNAPLAVRILGKLRRDKHDWAAMTDEQVIAAGEQANRMASSAHRTEPARAGDLRSR